VKLTLRERRVLFAGIVVVIAIMIFYGMISLLPDRERLLQKVDTDKSIILKQREILSLEQSYKKQAEQDDNHQKLVMTRLLPGDNSNKASAELQKVLKDFADQNGVEITVKTAVQEKKVQDNDFLTKVAVRIEINCSLEQLVNFLGAIENYDKFLKVEELVITSYRMQKVYQIHPSLMVAGYIRSPDTKQEAAATPGANDSQKASSPGKN
jgi:Tfp pilus assembly protein PilO